MKCIRNIQKYFSDVSIIAYWENNFKLKIKKNSNSSHIGFLFGFIEDQKNSCHISEYSISQTSLEQIFNSFAAENEEIIYQQAGKKEIVINNDYLQYLNIS